MTLFYMNTHLQFQHINLHIHTNWGLFVVHFHLISPELPGSDRKLSLYIPISKLAFLVDFHWHVAIECQNFPIFCEAYGENKIHITSKTCRKKQIFWSKECLLCILSSTIFQSVEAVYALPSTNTDVLKLSSNDICQIPLEEWLNDPAMESLIIFFPSHQLQ